MDTNKVILGIYNDPDHIYDTTKKLIHDGYRVRDVYSPFAIHGMDRVLGIKRSRLTVAAFCFAMTGIVLALTLQTYASYFDWQMNVGGKPSLHIPTYIPITFELAILCTAFGMVGCFFAVNKMVWGKNADIIDIRVTDDLFVVAIDIIPNKTDVAELSSILKNNGAIEIREREFED
ncbi:MAG: DUF3341 domain-containing protein [Bacteroidia bacterium]|jgi:hypothetical protein